MEKGNFFSQMQSLKAKESKPSEGKLLKVKGLIEKTIKRGDTTLNVSCDICDDKVFLWLRSEGFLVNKVNDQRDGDYVRIDLSNL